MRGIMYKYAINLRIRIFLRLPYFKSLFVHIKYISNMTAYSFVLRSMTSLHLGLMYSVAP